MTVTPAVTPWDIWKAFSRPSPCLSYHSTDLPEKKKKKMKQNKTKNGSTNRFRDFFFPLQKLWKYWLAHSVIRVKIAPPRAEVFLWHYISPTEGCSLWGVSRVHFYQLASFFPSINYFLIIVAFLLPGLGFFWDPKQPDVFNPNPNNNIKFIHSFCTGLKKNSTS